MNHFPIGSIALVFCLSATGCASSPVPGSFAEFFERAQTDRSFRLERVATDFYAQEELHWEGSTRKTIRRIPCSYREIERHGWFMLPDKERLSATGTAYVLPEQIKGDEVKVILGSLDGDVDAEDYFQLRGGKWFHTAMFVFSQVNLGQPPPALPCETRAQ